MGKFRVTAPDGSVFEVNAPDGASEADVMAYAQGEFAKQNPAITKPASVSVGDALKEVPRQIGLTARYGAEGLAQLAEIGTEPIRQMVTNPILRALGMPEGRRLSESVGGGLDAIGLPKPQGSDERVIGDAARLVAGAGGMIGAARGAGALANNAITAAAQSGKAAPVAQAVAKGAQTMATAPVQQAMGAAGAGLAGGSVREAGGGPWEQFAAALAGGIATPMAANAVGNAATKGANALTRALTPQSVMDQRVEQQITLALQRSGMDWSQVPERIRQSLRGEVASALDTGQPLNADAMRRLLVMQRAGVTPTVGQLTQDPGQITREMNLAKTGANSTDPALQRLPALQNQNTQTLLNGLDGAGARNAPSAAAAGRSAIESLDSTATRAQNEITALYNRARDTSGRSLPLEGSTFTRNANRLLDEQNVGSFLPTDIANKMNAVARGEFPLTVDVAEQLKTSIGNLQRGSADGNVRRALGLVRQALDDAPLQAPVKVNPGNLPAVPGTVPPSAAGAGEESIAAFNAARRANRGWMQRVEANPALRAVVDGVEPDQFVQKFIVGKGATAADVGRMNAELEPAAREQLRQYLARHLKDAATNSTDDVTKFSNSAYRKALKDIGDDKLGLFFTAEERQQLRDIGDAAKYMQAQPAGAAVNNSNSGALVLGRGIDVLDRLAGYVPLGGKDVIRGTIQGIQQRQVLTPANALRTFAPPAQKPNPLLALPIIAAGQGANDR